MAFGRRAWLSLMARGTVLAAGARVRAVEAQPTRYAADPRIKHIVVLMLENRSFDHMLGLLMRDIPDLRGVRPGDYFNKGKDGTRFYVTAGAEYQGQFPDDPPPQFENVHDQLAASEPARPPKTGFALTYQRNAGHPPAAMRGVV